MVEHISQTIGFFFLPSFFQFLYNKNPRGPFIGVVLIDVAAAIFTIVVCCFGFGNLPKVADGDDESNLSGSIESDNDDDKKPTSPMLVVRGPIEM